MLNRATRRLLSFAAVVVVCAATAAPGFARDVARSKQVARSAFDEAETMREALNGLAPEQRTRKDYARVIEAYRKVYYVAPTSAKADAAVFALGELLVQSGRQFDDEHTLRSAIGQFEFLRKEYPGSKYRVDALFTIAEIYRDDLNDREQAKATFQEFLKRYPQSDLSGDAKTALAALEKPEKPAKNNLGKNADRDTRAAKKTKETTAVAKLDAPEKKKDVRAATKPNDDLPESDEAVTPRVTGVRHWSTPDYTRVAIDIDAEVKYEAGRIGNPDRIFFDLYDTKVASSLIGKTFEVQDGLLRKVRVAQNHAGVSRVVLEVNGVADYSVFLLPNPYRLIIDIHGRKPVEPETILADRRVARENARDKAAGRESKTEVADPAEGRTDVVAVNGPKPRRDAKKANDAEKKIAALEQELKRQDTPTTAEDKTINVAKATQPELKATLGPTSKPTYDAVAPREKKRETLELEPAGKKKSRRTETPEEAAAREAKSLSTGERSLVRALGLKIGKIVVDAGHGGHDTGTVGPNGLMEKDLVLDVARRLGKLLEGKLGADVVYTREDDTFIPLETRTAIANQQQADLFISIHANSSSDPNARGVETYYLNFTSSPDALDVAARENAVSEKSIHELQDLVKKITLKDKIDESREFAADVQQSLYKGLSAKSPAIRNRGVKKAPFIVLIGANMPSILAEISFVSNPVDARHLQTPEYRQKIAESLYRGVASYVSGLAGVKVAASTRPAGETAR